MNKNLDILAQSASSDVTAPSSMSVLYLGAIHEDTELLIAMTALSSDKIKSNRFQYSYKLFKAGYPIVQAPDTNCVI